MTVRHETNFSIYDSGGPRQWAENELVRPDGKVMPGKKFIKDLINSTGCEISINAMPPGGSVPIYHAHKENEELYIFIGGEGEMRIDGVTFAVCEGSIVRVAPKGLRAWHNTGKVPLVCLVLQVREGSLRQYSATDGIRSEEPLVW